MSTIRVSCRTIVPGLGLVDGGLMLSYAMCIHPSTPTTTLITIPTLVDLVIVSASTLRIDGGGRLDVTKVHISNL